MICNWLNKILRWFGIDFPDVPEQDARKRKEKIVRDILYRRHYITYEDIERMREANANWDFVKGRRIKK